MACFGRMRKNGLLAVVIGAGVSPAPLPALGLLRGLDPLCSRRLHLFLPLRPRQGGGAGGEIATEEDQGKARGRRRLRGARVGPGRASAGEARDSVLAVRSKRTSHLTTNAHLGGACRLVDTSVEVGPPCDGFVVTPLVNDGTSGQRYAVCSKPSVVSL